MKDKKSYGKEHDVNLKLVIGLMRTSLSENRRMQNYLSDYDLTPAQFGVLEALYHLGDLKIGDLLEKTLSTSGNMTVVVKNLEKSGHVERHHCPNDKRSFIIRLTTKGHKLIETVFLPHLDELKRFFSPLEIEEKEQLINLLKKLNGIG